MCSGALELSHDQPGIRCAGCDHTFAVENGIPMLYCAKDWKSKADVTETVKAFYEETPFPTYDDFDTSASLRDKARQGIFARLLDDQIPFSAKILEAGTGTGQLSNFLGLNADRTVFAADMCVNSLRLAHAFKVKNEIRNVSFLQMNLFQPVFKPESFDLVISNGVLMCTTDPFGGFQSIARLVKKGGYIIIGLYNTYGRLTTDLRRLIFRIGGSGFWFLDSRLRDKNLSDTRKHSWYMDQYKHPHELKHTIGEVLQWFDRNGFEFVNAVPKCTPGRSLAADDKLFSPAPRGTKLDHGIVQLLLLLTGAKEGGFFTMIGRKPA